jgi:hypothetical protein
MNAFKRRTLVVGFLVGMLVGWTATPANAQCPYWAAWSPWGTSCLVSPGYGTMSIDATRSYPGETSGDGGTLQRNDVVWSYEPSPLVLKGVTPINTGTLQIKTPTVLPSPVTYWGTLNLNNSNNGSGFNLAAPSPLTLLPYEPLSLTTRTTNGILRLDSIDAGVLTISDANAPNLASIHGLNMQVTPQESTGTAAPVPEPGTLALLAAAVGLWLFRLCKKAE